MSHASAKFDVKYFALNCCARGDSSGHKQCSRQGSVKLADIIVNICAGSHVSRWGQILFQAARAPSLALPVSVSSLIP